MRSGATVIGARDFLVAYNVNLNTTSTRRANAVAFDLRENGRVKELNGKKVIDELGEVPDLIMLDPPRDGVNPKALMKILNFGVDRLVYIACKPTSLARDLEMIQGRGYKVEKIACVDLFPNTVHVEVVCCLHRVNS